MTGIQHDIERAFNAAIEHHREGRLAEAAEHYRKVLAIDANVAAALFNLSAIVLQAGNFKEGVELSRRAAALQPDNPGIHNNLGTALQHLGQYDEAISHFQKALALTPDDPKLHNNLGNARIAQGNPKGALDNLEKAVSLDPNYAEAHYNLASALKDLGRREEAAAGYHQAVTLAPNFPQGHFNLAKAYTQLGLLDDAVNSYRRSIEVDPRYEDAHSNLMMTLHYASGARGEELFKAATAWAKPYNDSLLERDFPNTPDPDRPLRIGYVSADFNNHPVGFYLERILPFHHDGPVAITCYSNSLKADDLTARLCKSVAHWREVHDLSDDTIIEQILEDQIDILVDLSGHTLGHRLPVFAKRPAPVQVSWMGYTGTTGLKAMDYILADTFVIPEDERGLYTEHVKYLPGSYLCFDPPRFDLATTPPPVLENGFITFATFNNRLKITPETITLWSEVLKSVAGSKLLLKTSLLKDTTVKENLIQLFCTHGIEEDRLILESGATRPEMLAAYRRADIALDTLPFGGGVTTAEALWMGVPVISLVSPRWPGRLGQTIETAVGTPELLAQTPEQYRHLAIDLAHDLPLLERYHETLRGKVEDSALCNGDDFTVKLEKTYRDIWQRWCERHDG